MKKYQYLASWDDQTLTRVGEPVVVLGDSNVSQVEVILPSDFLLDPTEAVARMYFLLPGEKESGFETLETATKDENGDSHVTWTIKHVHSQKGGRLAFSLTLIGDDAQWDSRTAIIPVYESRYQPESEEAEEPYTGRLTALEGSMASIRGEFGDVVDEFEELKETATLGTPVPKSLASEMVEGGVYLYTGSETGYTAGHVYYYVNGTLTDGGQYGGTTVDTTLTVSGAAADAKVAGDKIAEIEEDLSAVSESTINALLSVAPTWSNGSAVTISGGANQALTWACRTNYIVLSQPTMIRFGFDLTKYEYNMWAYTASSVSSAIRNLTGSVRVDNESYIYVPASGERCIRICVALKTKSGTLTDEELTTISNSISFYTATDKSLKLSNVAADSAATGIAIGKAQSVIQSGDICPKHIDGETEQNGITVVAKNGVYKISGTATANNVYNLFNNESALPSGIEAGKSYKLKVNIPSLYTKIRIAYYNGTEWALLVDGTYDTEFTVPVDAVGFYVRFFFYNNGLNSPQFEVCPRIYPINSIGEVEGESTPSRYPMMMTIIDDDGYGSFYTDLLPLCIEKCAPISSAVITARIGVSTGFMTWEQIEECSRKGAEILSHGYNHKTDAEILAEGTTVEQLAMWYRGARNDLELHGIRSDIFVFNNNTANVIQCQQAARRVYKAAFHAAGAEINHEGTTNPFYIKRFNFTASTLETAHTIEEMKANIDTLATAGTGWLVWMIHTSSTNGWSSAEVTKLGQAIDYARSLGIEIVTAERGCRTYLPYQGI